MKICPNPSTWNQVSKRLIAYALKHPCIPDQPPVPLILGGWAFSNDVQKMARWNRTVDWARANGCSMLVEVAEESFYCQETLTSYEVGPTGGPMLRDWDFQTRTRPPAEEISKHLQRLKSGWVQIVGDQVGGVTSPLRFQGAKARTLLVQADITVQPPWGGWTQLSQVEAKRRTFTQFRRAINQTIGPHEVDHIDFVPSALPNRDAGL